MSGPEARKIVKIRTVRKPDLLKSVVQHQRSSKTFKKETKLHKNHQNIPIYLKKKGAEKAPQKSKHFCVRY